MAYGLKEDRSRFGITSRSTSRCLALLWHPATGKGWPLSLHKRKPAGCYQFQFM